MRRQGGLGLPGRHTQPPAAWRAQGLWSPGLEGLPRLLPGPSRAAAELSSLTTKGWPWDVLWLLFLRSSLELLDSPEAPRGGSLVTIKDTRCWWQVGKHGAHRLPKHSMLGSRLQRSGGLHGTLIMGARLAVARGPTRSLAALVRVTSEAALTQIPCRRSSPRCAQWGRHSRTSGSPVAADQSQQCFCRVQLLFHPSPDSCHLCVQTV